MKNVIYKEIHVHDNTHSIKLYLKITKSVIEIIIFESEDLNSWMAEVPKEELYTFAQKDKIGIEEYCQKLLEWVNNENPNIRFIFKNDGEFIINRVLQKSLTVKCFSVKLRKTNFHESVHDVITFLFLENTSLSKDVAVLKSQNVELTTNKNECETKLNDLINKKEHDDGELMGQFLQVLNEKKTQIQHLTELLNAFKNGRPLVNPGVKVSSRKRKKGSNDSIPVTKKEEISESDQSEDNSYNSDDSSASNINNVPKDNFDGKSTSVDTQHYDFLEDDIKDTHILAKRIMPNKSEEDLIITPSTSKVNEQGNSTEDAVKVLQRRKSPTIDLSTQSLYDML